MKKNRVYLWNVHGYDIERIKDVISATIEEEGIEVKGNVLIKPNCVAAHPIYFTHAFTRGELLEGAISALINISKGKIKKIQIGERSGITIPTRLAFKFANYKNVAKKYGAKLIYFEEVRQVEVPLKNPKRLRNSLFIPEVVLYADFFLNIPKFKTHPWTTVTFSLKNFIGLQDEAHRLLDHDYRLDEKIADLQEIISPSLNVIDAIISGSGRMLTPKPVQSNLLIIGKNSLSVDAICCYLLGICPASVHHIRFCYERGSGDVEIENIEIKGDLPFDEAKNRLKDVKVGLIRVEDFFKNSPINASCGYPPDPLRSDYCWGGCPGAIEEAIDVISQVQQGAINKVKRMKIFYGNTGIKNIETEGKQKVLFIGDCATFEGKINGKYVKIQSTYKDSSLKDNKKARAEDIFIKMIKTYWRMCRARKKGWIRIYGCTVSVAEHVLLLSSLGGLKNPYFDRRVVIPFVLAWLKSKIVRFVKRIFGKLKPKFLS